MNPNNTKELELAFTEMRALWKYPGSGPHAITVKNAKHLDCYFNSDLVCDKPKLVEELCAKYFVPYLNSKNITPDYVVSYVPYGLVFGKELAKQIDAKFECIDLTNPHELEICSKDRVLVIADDIYGGGSTRETISLVENKSGQVENLIIVLANMSNSPTLDERDIYSLISPQVRFWTRDEDSPLPKDSQGLSARDKWDELVDYSKKL